MESRASISLRLLDYILILTIGIFATALTVFSQDETLVAFFMGGTLLLVLTYLFLWQFRLFVYAYIFLIPLSVPTVMGSNSLGLPSELLLLILWLALAMKAVLKSWIDPRVMKHPAVIAFALYLTWMLITSIFSEMPMVSLKRTFITSVFFLVFVLFLQGFFRTVQNIRWFIISYGLGCVVPVIYSIRKLSLFDFNMGASYDVTRPFFADHTMYAACLVFILVFAIGMIGDKSGRSPILPPLSALVGGITAVGIYFSFSRAAWLSLVVAVLVAFILRYRPRFQVWMGAFLILLALGWWKQEMLIDLFERNKAVSSKGDLTEHVQSLTNISSDASNAERLNRWFSAFRMFQDRPILGFGPGTYQFQYAPYQAAEDMTRISTMYGDRGNSHSEFLNILTESGIPGLIMYLVFLGILFFRGFLLLKSKNPTTRRFSLLAITALAAYFAHGMVNAFMDIDKVAVLVYGCIAMILSLDICERTDSVPADSKYVVDFQ